MDAEIDDKYWKSEPDEYFSWALSVAMLSKGHLLVDILPDDNSLYTFTVEEQSLLGINFDIAIRYCLDSPNVTRIVCSPHCSPEHLYHAVSRPMKKSLMGKKAADVYASPDSRNENHHYHTHSVPNNSVANPNVNSNSGRSARSRGVSRHHSHHAPGDGRPQTQQTVYTSRNVKYEKINLKEETLVEKGKLPYVLVVQDIDLLPRRTQLALLELMVTGVMPVKLVPRAAGSDPVPVAGVTQLPKRFLVVALTSAVPEHTLDYDSIQRSECREKPRAQLLPALFDEFTLRIPIKLPPRKFLLQILTQKLKKKERDESRLGTIHVNTPNGEDNKAIKKWIDVAEGCLLWPSRLKVNKSNLMLRKDIEEKNFSRVHRITQDKLETRALSVLRVHVSLAVKQQLRDIITALRTHNMIISGPSLQALQDLERAVRAVALLASQQDSHSNYFFVCPHHVLNVVIESLAHRIVLCRRKQNPLSDDIAQLDNKDTTGKVNESEKSQSPKSAQFKNPPEHWHSVTAARLIVAQVFEHYIPIQR